MKSSLIKHWGIFIILLLSFFVTLPLFHTGFFPVHDDTQVQRVFEMGKSLSDGMFPVRWVQDLGYAYGYPIFTFYAPLAYYFGGTLVVFHLTALLATKIMMGLGIILAGVTMYLLARSIWGETGGTIAGLLYLFAPYHALDIYVRGDVSEFWAYGLLPLAIYGLWQSTKTGKFRYVLWGAIGVGGIILSHNLTAFMVLPFLVLIAGILIFLQKGWKRALPVLILVFGLGFAAFYFLPVPFEMAYTNVLSQVGGTNDFHRHFVCLQQLWYSPWGYGGSIPGCIDGISFALGKIYIFLLILAALITPIIFKRNKEKGMLLIISVLGVLFSLFMLLQISQPLWNVIPKLAFLQYPWRFFILVFFFLSFSGGGVVWIIQQIKHYGRITAVLVSFIIAASLILIQGKYFVPKQYNLVTSSFYTNKYMLTWTTSKISDEYMPKYFAIPQKAIAVPQSLFALQGGKGIIQENQTQIKQIQVIMNTSGILHLNIAYYPAWHAFVDGKEVPLQQVQNGMQIPLEQGSHIVVLLYQSTLIEQIGNIVSLTSILASIIAIIFMARRKLL